MAEFQQGVGRRALLLGSLGLGLLAVVGCSQQAAAMAAPTWDFGMGPNVPANLEVAVLAGGCFWGVQAVFAHTKGVKEAISGYTGGHKENPTYEEVTTGLSGHAEAVRVVFDPKEITYDEILQIFFSVATDPTEVNRQGPDIGPQYRNEIYFTSPEQERLAKSRIAQLESARVYRKPIATKVTRLGVFYPAEAYHQDYLFLNPDNPYIVIHDYPKLEALKVRYPQRYLQQPTRLAGI